MAEDIEGPPAPLDPIESYKLAFDMFSMICVAVVLSLGLIFFGLTNFDSGEDSDAVFSAIFVVSGIILGVVGTIAIVYKLLIDVISTGIHRGTNPQEYQIKPKNLQNGAQKNPASKKITNIVECVNCGQYLRVPKNFSGNIHCTKCHTRFKLDHQETDHDLDSDSS